MIEAIIRFSVRHKAAIVLGVLAWVALGVFSFTRLAIDAVPDITNNQVQVLSLCPTLAAQEVERYVTAPLEMGLRSIPGVVELRSISRFGLSVITVVFEEEVDIYLARQLASEKLREVQEHIPEGFGRPELAPISTGLGEILHYRIEAKPGYEERFSATELRSLQDWVVRRQLMGTPGVVEINSFGGFLKEYEVAVDPAKLAALGLSISDLYDALAHNNQNTGAAYIEREGSAYFIRSEGVARSEDDLRRIPVKHSGSLPVYLQDVATVQSGHAIRYGAVTHNGEGEIVVGIVMMLKGENAAKVVGAVKKRLAEIEKTLPEGVQLTPFLDREKLVKRTIDTVKTNLIEGALIVVFILVLLVGNLRAGLIIASVIPLSMLFAISMMHLFGVSANLMSLGAIDFGLVVDGAVIVVEASLHFLQVHFAGRRLTPAQSDEATQISAARILKSAVFGQVIILIVYLPILSLTGIEGKMFKPMAQTVSFAIIGAMILSMTYVPMMTAWVMPGKVPTGKNFSDRIIGFLHRMYRPVLHLALRGRAWVLGLTLAALAGSLILFLRLGGEFIPQLDEGDLLMHGFCTPGTSLTQSVANMTLVEKIVREFPQVEQVISKTGSAEIPTDPMSIETADIVILLKPQSEWPEAISKEELIERIEKKVLQVPGMGFEFTQPIEMRFNEMMTGVRSDVAVKLYGDNLDTLAEAGRRIQSLMAQVNGIGDVKVEQILGLPQITVRYDFRRMAGYGLHVQEVNAALRAAFAGEIAGQLYEDERRFNIVLRLPLDGRAGLDDVRKLLLHSPNGSSVPLSELADVDYQLGPAQISRDDARRRIVVGANVRGRDVESVVHELRELLGEKLRLPVGYHLSYGGQFENLQAAKARLSLAVPAALFLILVLLYFTFQSMREALLIFSSVPMAAIGGVLSLWLRDMPFSISAGVGFIALFGVAVLNGIVLIAHFNQLEKEGYHNRWSRILRGTQSRLRPVIMTAAVASLGFLPMALSQGAGAEVQRPLATVVIGGLISSTLLTLVVLPVLYSLFVRKVIHASSAMLLLLLLAPAMVQAQPALREDEAVALALQRAPALRAALLESDRRAALQGTRNDPGKTSFFQNTQADPDYGPFGVVAAGLSQSFDLPGVYRRRGELLAGEQLRAEQLAQAEAQSVAYAIRRLYADWAYWDAVGQQLRRIDSSWQSSLQLAALRQRAGESSPTERIAIAGEAGRVRLALEALPAERARLLARLSAWLPDTAIMPVAAEQFRAPLPELDTQRLLGHPLLQLAAQAVEIAQLELKLARSERSPEISLSLYGQRVPAPGRIMPGYAAGLAFPLFSRAAASRIEAAGIQVSAQEAAARAVWAQHRSGMADALAHCERIAKEVLYYEQEGKALAAELLRSSLLRFRSGESAYVEHLSNLRQAAELEMLRIGRLHDYQLALLELRYWMNQL